MCAGGGVGNGGGGGREEGAVYTVVDDEEGCGGGGGAEEDGGETGIDAADCLAERESWYLGAGGVARSLESGFDCVEWVEGAVDSESCDGAGLRDVVSVSSESCWEILDRTRRDLVHSEETNGSSPTCWVIMLDGMEVRRFYRGDML